MSQLAKFGTISRQNRHILKKKVIFVVLFEMLVLGAQRELGAQILAAGSSLLGQWKSDVDF